MISRHFRYRMGFATLLPLLLVVLATAGAFWHWRVQDLEDAHRQRIRLVTHQFAIFCANGLFSGNTVSLQNVIAEIQREPDLLSVYVLDASGRVVAWATTCAAFALWAPRTNTSATTTPPWHRAVNGTARCRSCWAPRWRASWAWSWA